MSNLHDEPVEQKGPNVLRRTEAHIQRKTVDGLIELIPLLITVIIILYFVRVADSFVSELPFVKSKPWDFPGLGVVVFVVLFYVIGLVVSKRAGRKLMAWKHIVLSNTPVVKAVYGISYQVMGSLTSQYNFSRVVFLEWPREGMMAMGFVTGQAYYPDKGVSIVVVYIPTVPNPTSGNMAFVIEDDVMETDISVEDAMRLVFSGGIVMPDSVSLARVSRTISPDAANEYVGRFESEAF